MLPLVPPFSMLLLVLEMPFGLIDLVEKVLRAMRVFVTAEAPTAAAAAEVFLRNGADSSLEALRLRLAGAAADADEDSGDYYAELRELRDEVAAALRAATQPTRDEL